jgi:glycosyltransferase involved in cell wall biosynthesis
MHARMKHHIVIASGNHLSSNPRVCKEAAALTEAGFQVTVIGGSVSASQKAKDRRLSAGESWQHVEAFDMSRGGWNECFLKVQRRLGIALWRKFCIANRWQLFYGVDAIRGVVRRQRADLVIAHWEPALPAALDALTSGQPVGVDMEDWFSEDLPEESRTSRPVKWLAEMEARLLRDGRHTTCTSDAMADALAARYECRRPVVVRNVFPSSERAGIDGAWKDRSVDWHPRNQPDRPRPADAAVSFHWFSQTIGPHRGLESVFRALESVKGAWELHLRGDLRGYERWLETECPRAVRGRIRVHELVEPGELASRIAEHDVGLALELTTPPSRDLTITNKMFQYLQAGLAVVASDTAGQREVAAAAARGAVALFRNGDAVQLRETLQRLVTNRNILRGMRSVAWAAGAELVWENEAPKLVESVVKAVTATQGRP